MSKVEVRVPDLGDFSAVDVVEIHVKPGDRISAEDPLVTLETDKATMDFPAPRAGTVVSVALSADEGRSWVPMELKGTPRPGLRQLWQGRWTPPGPGSYTLLTRATDAGGAVQPLHPRWNRLGYGNNAVQRVRVTITA